MYKFGIFNFVEGYAVLAQRLLFILSLAKNPIDCVELKVRANSCNCLRELKVGYAELKVRGPCFFRSERSDGTLSVHTFLSMPEIG